MGFKEELKQTAAAYPRGKSSYILSTDRLQIVYRKYTNTEPIPEGTTRVNYIFCHGTGMTKSVWHTHIKELYARSEKNSDWKIGTVVSIDAAGHGDSGILNKGKIAWGFDWRDGSKDVIQLVKNEIETTGDFAPSAYERNILVGHSFGGFIVTYAAALEPSLFDSCIAVEPVLMYNRLFDDVFFQKVTKLALFIKDEFPTREAAETYFRKTFYKVLEDRVRRDLLDDEIYEEDGKFKTKSTVRAQMATYTSVYSVLLTEQYLKLLEIPYLHVVGSDATWNAPMTPEFVQENVPEHLFEAAVLKGDHLVHGQNVKDTVELIWDFSNRRAKFIAEDRQAFPEVKYNYDREKLVENMYKVMLSGNVDSAIDFGAPRKPKL